MNKKSAKISWLIVLTGGMFFFFEFTKMTIFNSIGTSLLHDFGISAYQLGQLSACYFYSQVLFLFPAGLLLDRFSVKKLILLSLFISILGTTLFSQSSSFALAAFARCLGGIGGSFAFLSCIKLASRWFKPEKMSLVTGVLVTLAFAGGIFAQTPFTLMIEHVGWRESLVFLSLIGFCIFLLILLIVEDNPEGSIKQEKPLSTTSFLTSLKKSLCNGQTFKIGLYIALMNLPIVLLGSLWGQLFLSENKHFDDIHASYITTMLFAGIIIGSPLFGYFSDKLKKRKIPMLIGTISSLIISMSIIYTNNLTLLTYMMLFFFLGFVSSAQCIGYPTIIENNKLSLAATASGIASIIIMGSGALLKVLFGLILDQNWNGQKIDNIPLYSSSEFMHAMMILPIGFIMAIIVLLLVKETNCQFLHQE